MNSELINKIVLVGNNSNLYIAALLLSKNLLQLGVEIVCIELLEGDVSCPVVSIGGEFSSLFEMIEESPLKGVIASQGIFSYGTHYYNGDQSWFCPYGQYGLVNAENEFEQGIFRYLGQGDANRLDDYSLAAVAAKDAKFAIAGASRPELQSALEFGAFLDAGLYKQHLKELFAKSGNKIVECDSIIKIIRNDDCEIKEIITDRSSVVSGDFWFDCSGDKAYLAAGLNSYQKSAFPWFKCDRVFYFMARGGGELDEPFSTVRYTDIGFIKKIPLKSKTWYEVHVDPSQSDESQVKRIIETEIGAHIDYMFDEELRVGALPSPWVGNCLFAGHSGLNPGRGVVSESSLVQEAIIRFLDVYPSRASVDVAARGYNDSWANVIQETADYVVLHILLHDMKEKHSNGQLLPESLNNRINLFKRLGRLPVNETDIVRDQQWYAMLFGLGVRPELYSIMIESITDQEMEDTLSKLKLLIKKIGKSMPSNQEFLTKFCS